MSILDQRTLKNTQDEDAQNNPQQSSQTPTIGRSAGFNTGASPTQPKGSGRFTNLQKYVTANEGAGENIANRISNQTNRDLGNFNQSLDKTNEKVSSGINMGRQAVDNQGAGFTSRLQGYKDGIGSFNNIGDRGNLDKTSQDMADWINKPTTFNTPPAPDYSIQPINGGNVPVNNVFGGTNPGIYGDYTDFIYNEQTPQGPTPFGDSFQDFQKFQNGQVIDDAGLLKSQQGTQNLANGMVGQLQKQANGLQTEQGRYDLLRNAAPKNGNYSMGQGRFDQLLFQTNPTGITNMQNTFKNQIGDTQNKVGALTAQGNDLNKLITDETALRNNLGGLATSAQDAFNSKFDTDANKKMVNDARNSLYDSYKNQIQSGQYTKDVADDLGIGSLNSYNPTGSMNQATPNQFRQYNLQKDHGDNLNAFLTHGRDATSMQDLLSQNDYGMYQNLAALSGHDTGRASGASTLDRAVRGTGALPEYLKQQNDNFTKNYAGKTYNGSYEDPGIAYGTANTTLGDYLGRGDSAITNTATGIRDSNVDPGFQMPATQTPEYARQQAINQVRNAINSDVSSTGFQNLATINQDPTQALAEQEQYKRFKGLL